MIFKFSHSNFLFVFLFIFLGSICSHVGFSTSDKQLVMVSYNRHTSQNERIKKQAGYLYDASEPGHYFGRAVFFVSPQERDLLALSSHQDIGLCGGVIPYELSIASTTETFLGSSLTTLTADAVTLSALSQVQATRIQSDVSTLVNMGSRYYSGSKGATATSTVKSLWQDNLPSGASVSTYSHSSSTVQSSIIVKLGGTTSPDETVILGAHIDSINKSDQTAAPGADDDATGIATLTEILRIIKSQNLQFKRTIEIHGYAAEEVGLLGSYDIAKSYKSAGRKIAGMMQFDMNGYTTTETNSVLFVVPNYTTTALNRVTKDLIGVYGLGTWQEIALSAGTSDHQSWYSQGFHTTFPFEHPINHNQAIHSTKDTSDLLDFTYSARFAKLGLAFVSHMAGLTTANATVSTPANTWKALSATGTSGLKQGIVEVDSNDSSKAKLVTKAPSGTEAVVGCYVAAVSSPSCLDDIRDLTFSRFSGTNKLYYTKTEVNLKDKGIYRFISYDAQNKPLLVRHIKVSKK
jgi:hypothetical protein